MALMKCPECHKEISDQAVSCPNCGYPIREKLKQKKEKEAHRKQAQQQQQINYNFEYKGVQVNGKHVASAIRREDIGLALVHAEEDIVSKIPSELRTYNEAERVVEEVRARFSVQPRSLSQLPKSPTLTCPTCGRHNVRQISYAERGVSAGIFGLFSKTARSQFECKDCGYKW